MQDERDDSFWPQIAGDWSRYREHVRSRWNGLSDDDLDYMAGERGRVLERIRERHSDWNENDIERELGSMRNL